MRLSRLPGLLGLCQGDVPGICGYLNAAQERLLKCRESGGESWWGTWAEVAFGGISRAEPFITTPREIARIEKINVCRRPVMIQNQFYEYLDFGNGRMPQRFRDNWCLLQGYTRNNTPTFADITNGPKIIRVFATDPADVGATKRVFFSGLDPQNEPIWTTDSLNQVQGQFVPIQSPFSDASIQMNAVYGVQKDPTVGQVQIFQVDPTTGVQSLILTMQPNELVSGYRRYYINNLPCDCCNSTAANHCDPTVTPQPIQILAIVKLEPIPVNSDTDYLLLQNSEALIHECQSVRYDSMDSPNAKNYALEHHTSAVRLLQGELVHYLGKDKPAVNFAPFGSARLERVKIGMI